MYVGLRNFEDELQRLRNAGVRRSVVTADHGFLLQDDTTRRPVPHGCRPDPGSWGCTGSRAPSPARCNGA